jgi:hypothetical protein
MRTEIYQSLWLQPALTSENEGFIAGNNRFNGGWYTPELYYLSLAYSFYKLKYHYSNVSLICDHYANTLLVDILGLTYENVNMELDKIDISFSKSWALGKIYAYRIANNPFQHYDGDVFLWERTKQFTTKNELIFQNYEYNETYYRDSLTEIHEKLSFIPSELKNINKNIVSINAGVIGCNSADFIKEYTEKALEFVHTNSNCLKFIDQGRFNTVFEQLLCYKIAIKRKIKMTPNLRVSRTNNSYNLNKLTNFYNIPDSIKYIHPLGFKKKIDLMGAHLHKWFNYEFPDEYRATKHKINDAIEYVKKPI